MRWAHEHMRAYPAPRIRTWIEVKLRGRVGILAGIEKEARCWGALPVTRRERRRRRVLLSDCTALDPRYVGDMESMRSTA